VFEFGLVNNAWLLEQAVKQGPDALNVFSSSHNKTLAWQNYISLLMHRDSLAAIAIIRQMPAGAPRNEAIEAVLNLRILEPQKVKELLLLTNDEYLHKVFASQ
jgi:hypothetical protein